MDGDGDGTDRALCASFDTRNDVAQITHTHTHMHVNQSKSVERTLQVPTPMAPRVIIMVSETMSSSPFRKAKMEASFDFCGVLCVVWGIGGLRGQGCVCMYKQCVALVVSYHADVHNTHTHTYMITHKTRTLETERHR